MRSVDMDKMEGKLNSAYAVDAYSAAPSPESQPRRRAARRPVDEEDAGVVYRSAWAGMGEAAVTRRSSHRVWRWARTGSLMTVALLWAAMFVACVALLARGGDSGGALCPPGAASPWYRAAVGYQIPPASYQDSDEDGIGDLKGILLRLDYLEFLGVDAVWLGSICPSSGMDLWADVTNFTAIDRVFGTMQDFGELVKAAHAGGMKLVLEFLPSRTSDLHPWFQGSRQGRSNDFADYYIWADGSNGGPPRYTETGSGSKLSWEYDSTRRQWYLYSHIKEEPVLNYMDTGVNRDMQTALRFWLDKGVDGFYIRHMDHILESLVIMDKLRGNEGSNDAMLPEDDLLEARNKTLDVITGWRRLLDEYETPDEPQSDSSKLLVVDTGGHLSLTEAVSEVTGVAAFNFMLLAMRSPLDGHELREAIGTWLAMGPADETRIWTVGTADVSRVSSRAGQGFTAAMMFLALLLPGSPLIYYGDEIGMSDGQRMDTTTAAWNEAEIMRADRELTRSPMQWSPAMHAGFTETSVPWMPVGANASVVNVQVQRQDNGSLLSLVHRLLRFRKEKWSVFGEQAPGETFRPLTAFKEVVAFARESPRGTAAVFAALNVADYEVTENFESAAAGIPGSGTVVVSSHHPGRLGQAVDLSRLLLLSGEVLLVQYEPVRSSYNSLS